MTRLAATTAAVLIAGSAMLAQDWPTSSSFGNDAGRTPAARVAAAAGLDRGPGAAENSPTDAPIGAHPDSTPEGSVASGVVAGLQTAAAGDLIGFSALDGSGSQTITLINAEKSWMAVYHIDGAGTIRLVSSRPIDADFSLQLNATAPLPEKIRRLENR